MADMPLDVAVRGLPFAFDKKRRTRQQHIAVAQPIEQP